MNRKDLLKLLNVVLGRRPQRIKYFFLKEDGLGGLKKNFKRRRPRRIIFFLKKTALEDEICTV